MTDLLIERGVPSTLRHTDRLYINGEWVAPRGTRGFDVVDASTEETFLHVAEAGPAEMDAAIAAARHAFDHSPWPTLEPAERAVYLRRLAEGLRARSDELGTFWTREAGATYSMTRFAVQRVPAGFDYFADLAESYPFVTPAKPEFSPFGVVAKEPVGVVAAIVPWNTALSLAAHKVAPALLAGCTIVLKAPPEAPGELYVLAEIAEEIGLPPGVLNLVTADREVSEQLVRDPRIDKVSFTGSSVVGKRIASILGERVGRYTLELGGKSAALVLDDWDMEAAAQTLAAAECSITGQVCSSLTRVIVSRARHDEFAEALGAAFGAKLVGDPFDPASSIGPLAMQRQQERVLGYVQKGIDEGATLVTGGRRPEHLDRGWYVEPTVFSNVDNRSTIAQEEIFGPVISVIPADDVDQAIDMANDTVYGLNSAVFTHDVDAAYRIARRLRTGTVGHNGFKADAQMGLGGFKQSGIGREGGIQGILPYLESKSIILDDVPESFR
ncbi:aldehyde dehydrogenase [Rathayibacter sp. VKM Ac-2835]|uniref:aldehyde dehydrogenase n=1 Tax=Rathayibacter sp. VKM Ac-2835 TaxID=2739043 RepID=UPI0015632005|nr:aldehyde dehydrogenase [Rathayibacter sp. VKM Ac-2835]NRG41048.1 aldehyde dehydrogenase [Rathayibacter sp. VKM Ac-2835]